MKRKTSHIAYGISGHGAACISLCLAICATLYPAAVSCTKTEAAQEPDREDLSDRIAFYVKAAPTRAVIEDTDALYSLHPDIYVTEENRIGGFDDLAVQYTDNGVWRSGVDWAAGNQAYSFYAYTYSGGSGTDGGKVEVPKASGAGNGYRVILTQPSAYPRSDDAWADFLMSYRVSANSSTKGLVKLEFERITTGVELYMSKNPNIGEVTLKSAEFSDVINKATYNLVFHASSADPTVLPNGMKNNWQTPSSPEQTTTYRYAPAGGLKINDFTPSSATGGGFAFDSGYLVMNFLTVPQDTYQELSGNPREIVLTISYSVVENGVTVNYDDQKFLLKDSSPAVWNQGHKVRYYLHIDSSIELVGVVAPWKDIDFIEGTLLPSLPGTEGQNQAAGSNID